jgi:Ca2+/Na+ antiporter
VWWTGKRHEAKVDAQLELLRRSYDEVLDATKHQDDKIGRLFTGVSFLTAAALALANLGDPRYLSQKYTEFAKPVELPPLGIMALAVYLVLVIICVMLLINSLATPLRVPGGKSDPASVPVPWAGNSNIKASQIFFFSIAKYSVHEWSQKWTATPLDLKRELVASLINENHNLAVRTQFKYGRTSEAISVFNLALLFLSLTVVFGATAAASDVSAGNGPAAINFPALARIIASSMFGLYLFFQLQSSIRYSRQTVNELLKRDRLGYGFAFAATAWVTLLALGAQWGLCERILIVGGTCAVASVLLLVRTYRTKRSAEEESKKKSKKKREGAKGSLGAVIFGVALSLVVIFAGNDEVSFGAASLASLICAGYAFYRPSQDIRRNRLKHADRIKDSAQPSDQAPRPHG